MQQVLHSNFELAIAILVAVANAKSFIMAMGSLILWEHNKC